MSFKDQFNLNNNQSKQNNEKETTPLRRPTKHDVEFADEAAREAGLDLEMYEQNKPQ